MRVLIIDDQASLLDSMRFFFEQRKCNVYTALTGEEGLKKAFKEKPSLVILDLKLPDIDGQIILKKLRNQMPATQVIIITAFQDMENTINCIKLGAFDFIHKPIDINELDSALNRFNKISRSRTSEEESREPNGVTPHEKTPYIVGKTKPMKEVFKKIAMVSDSNVTVLIQGESGTGKELIARTIHCKGAYKEHPFMVVDCSTLVDSLTESQLFGYEKGAFTGAETTRKGTLELAGEGTIFFDEIGEMPLRLQSKLLRFLHEKDFMRVGSSKILHSNARILAATNLDLTKMATKGDLRQDLFYRLRVVTIQLPPLRDRRADIPLLANYFLKKIAQKHHMPVKTLTPEAIQQLESYAWPGNVRELENSLTRAAVLTKLILLTKEDILNAISETGVDNLRDSSERTLAEIEKDHILQVLKAKQGNLGEACRTLGITRPTLRRKLSQYGYHNNG